MRASTKWRIAGGVIANTWPIVYLTDRPIVAWAVGYATSLMVVVFLSVARDAKREGD